MGKKLECAVRCPARHRHRTRLELGGSFFAHQCVDGLAMHGVSLVTAANGGGFVPQNDSPRAGRTDRTAVRIRPQHPRRPRQRHGFSAGAERCLVWHQRRFTFAVTAYRFGQFVPEAAARWLTERGHVVQRGKRVRQLLWNDSQWRVDGEPFDRVICATSSANAAAMLIQSAQVAPENIANAMRTWAQTASALHFEAIATVYAKITEKSNQRLPHPMLALRSGADAPAQFVFDRGQLGGATGLLAFVVSASHGSREEVQAAVLAQAAQELAPLHLGKLEPVQTIIEKHATFACTPNLQRPAQKIVTGLFAAGDYVEGVYPATLEGAVRSGLQSLG